MGVFGNKDQTGLGETAGIPDSMAPSLLYGLGGGADGDPLKNKMLMAMLSAHKAGGPAEAMGAGMGGDGSPDLAPSSTFASQPSVTLGHARMEDQPAAADVTAARQSLHDFEHPGLFKQIARVALPAFASFAAGRGYNGSEQQKEVQQEAMQQEGLRQQQHRNLMDQLQHAETMQTQQYDADQRNRMQDLIAAGNNQTKQLTAQIAATSRGNVAQTAADARRYGADQGLQGREYTADQNLAGRTYTADQNRASRSEVAKTNADAALNRFLAGQARTDARQQAGFEHGDMKPTADEDRRADLSTALSGYIDAIQDIATRRPELFGPVGGRSTQVKNFIGSSDPDVATLKLLKEQAGLTQLGAHSMRSATALQGAADALVNSFNTDAGALTGPDGVLTRAQKGLTSFTGPQVRPQVVRAGGTQRPTLTQQTANQKQSYTADTVPVGQVYNGYKYMGGDRKNKANWQQVVQ